MEIILLISKCVFLFISIRYLSRYIIRFLAKDPKGLTKLDALLLSIGITGFIALQWLI